MINHLFWFIISVNTGTCFHGDYQSVSCLMYATDISEECGTGNRESNPTLLVHQQKSINTWQGTSVLTWVELPDDISLLVSVLDSLHTLQPYSLHVLHCSIYKDVSSQTNLYVTVQFKTLALNNYNNWLNNCDS